MGPVNPEPMGMAKGIPRGWKARKQAWGREVVSFSSGKERKELVFLSLPLGASYFARKCPNDRRRRLRKL